MSINCIRCVTAERNGVDLLCNKCRLAAATVSRLATHDQDWEACKDWWRGETVENRLIIQAHICDRHPDPLTERMSLMAQLVLDRLLTEVWPGPSKTEPQ